MSLRLPLDSVVGSKRLFADRECAFVKRLGFGGAALVTIELGEVAERRADIVVVRAEFTLRERQHALYDFGRFGVIALLVKLCSLSVQGIKVAGLGSTRLRDEYPHCEAQY